MAHLTQEQRAFFDTFGFLVFPRCFSAAEMAVIAQQFDEVMLEARGGRPFDGQKRQVVMEYVERRPALSALLEDDRVYEPVEDLLGPGFSWLPSDGNVYVGDTSWHPDRREIIPEYTAIKVALYLDPVRRDSGCLRAIPGSHRPGPWRDELLAVARHREKPPVYPFGATGPQIPAHSLESDPGDVVLFNHYLLHASFGGSSYRRMFTLNFASRPTRPEHVADQKWNYELTLKMAREDPAGPSEHVYDPAFLAGGGPRRQSMLRHSKEMGWL